MEVCVGIDFGTTNSCIAYADNINSDGKVIQVNGKNFVPTNLIYYKNSNEPLACVDKSTSDIEPGNCLHNIKRIIGKDLLDEDIQNRKSNWDFKLVEGNNKMAAFQVKTKDGRCIVSPEQAAAHVYKKLINAAKSTQESENCKAKVVLTIPVAFNAEQCERIKSAAKAAKIDILSTIYEPTAAAIASNVMSSGKNQKLMIFDFGGGTLDVTIMEMSKDSEGVFKFKTIAITGDPDLGGEVIDEMLMDHFSQILEKYDYKVKTGDDEMTSRNLRTLRDTCHKMKEELTYKTDVDFTWPGINFKPRDSKILSSKFQMMMEEKGYTDRIRTTVKTCLNKANYKPKDVDKVICVGGSSVMKVVKKTLEDIFDEEKISISKHPEEDIAKGAAIYAYLLHSGGVKNVLNTPPPTRQKCPVSIIVENNLPFSIGYTDAYGDMDEIFEKGIVIPVSRTISVSSASNTQSNMYLRVCYRNDYDENPKSLTSYIIDYNGARGDKVKETWSIDAGGNLTITSVLASSGKIISKNVGLFETSSEIYCDSENDITFDCAHNSEINRRNEISSDSENDRRNESQHDPEMDSIKQQIRDEISNAIKKMKILPQLKSIKVQLDEISRWLDSDEKRTKEEYNKKLEEVRNLVQRGRAPDVSAGINRTAGSTNNSENDRRTEITRNSENDNSSESSSFSDTDSSTVSSSDSGNDRRNESQHDPEMDSIKQQIRDEISNAIKKMKILPQLKSIKVQLDEISRWLDSDEKRTKEEYNKKLEEVRNLVQRGRAPDVSAGINRTAGSTNNSENDRRTEITRNSENDNSSESSSFSDTDSSTVSSSDSGNDRRNESQHDPEMDSIKQQIRDEISNAIKKMKILPQLKSIKVQLDEISRWLDSDEKRTKEEYNKKLEEVRNLVQRGRAPDVSAGINRTAGSTNNSENDRRTEITRNSENDNSSESSSFSDTDSSTVSSSDSGNDRRDESQHDPEMDSIKQQIRDEISNAIKKMKILPQLKSIKVQLDEISRWLDSDEKRTKEEYNKKLEEVRNLVGSAGRSDVSAGINRRPEITRNSENDRRNEITRNSENDRRNESTNNSENDRRPEITRNSENDRRNESTNNSENDRRPEITRNSENDRRNESTNNSENDRRNESPHDSEIDSIKQQIRDEISKGRDSVSRRPVLRVMKGPQLDEISRWLDSDEKRTKEEYNKKLEEVRNLNKRYQTTDASTDDNRRTESFHNPEINRRTETTRSSENDRRDESQHDPEMDSIKQQIRDEISNAIKKMKILPQLKSIKVQLDEISRWLDSDEKRTKEEYNKKLEEVRNLVQRGRAPDVSAGINRTAGSTNNSENDRRTEITRNSENDNSSESSSFSDTDSSTVSSSDSGNDRRNESQHDPEMDSIKQQIRDEISNAIKKMKILPQLKSIKVQLDEISRWLDSDEKRTKEEYNKKLEEVRNLVGSAGRSDVSAGINRRPEITRNSENDRRNEITRNSENDRRNESTNNSENDRRPEITRNSENDRRNESTNNSENDRRPEITRNSENDRRNESTNNSENDRRNESPHDSEIDSIKQQIRDEISKGRDSVSRRPVLRVMKGPQLDEISRWLDSDEKRTKEEYNKKLEEVRNLNKRYQTTDASTDDNRRTESFHNPEINRRTETTRSSENDRRDESQHDPEMDSIKQQIRDEISNAIKKMKILPQLKSIKVQLDEISRWLDSDEKRTKEEYNKKLEEVRNLVQRGRAPDVSAGINRTAGSTNNSENDRRTEITRNSENDNSSESSSFSDTDSSTVSSSDSGNDRRNESQHDPEMDSIKQQIRDEISNAIKKMKILPQLKSIKVQLDEISRWLDSDEKRTKEEYNKKLEEVRNLVGSAGRSDVSAGINRRPEITRNSENDRRNEITRNSENDRRNESTNNSENDRRPEITRNSENDRRNESTNNSENDRRPEITRNSENDRRNESTNNSENDRRNESPHDSEIDSIKQQIRDEISKGRDSVSRRPVLRVMKGPQLDEISRWLDSDEKRTKEEYNKKLEEVRNLNKRYQTTDASTDDNRRTESFHNPEINRRTETTRSSENDRRDESQHDPEMDSIKQQIRDEISNAIKKMKILPQLKSIKVQLDEISRWLDSDEKRTKEEYNKKLEEVRNLVQRGRAPDVSAGINRTAGSTNNSENDRRTEITRNSENDNSSESSSFSDTDSSTVSSSDSGNDRRNESQHDPEMDSIKQQIRDEISNAIKKMKILPQLKSIKVQLDEISRWLDSDEKRTKEEYNKKLEEVRNLVGSAGRSDVSAGINRRPEITRNSENDRRNEITRNSENDRRNESTNNSENDRRPEITRNSENDRRNESTNNSENDRRNESPHDSEIDSIKQQIRDEISKGRDSVSRRPVLRVMKGPQLDEISRWLDSDEKRTKEEYNKKLEEVRNLNKRYQTTDASTDDNRRTESFHNPEINRRTETTRNSENDRRDESQHDPEMDSIKQQIRDEISNAIKKMKILPQLKSIKVQLDEISRWLDSDEKRTKEEYNKKLEAVQNLTKRGQMAIR